MNTEVTVRGPQGERTLLVAHTDCGRPLSELLRRAGLPLNTRCGERGLCRGCLIEWVEGDCVVETESQGFAGGAHPLVRGCETFLRAGHPVTIQIPSRSLLAHGPQVVTSFRLNVPWTQDPLWQPDPHSQTARCYDEHGWRTIPCSGEPSHAVGAAIDLGTTTVVVAIVDLQSGSLLGQSSALNSQTLLGDNVLTRINLCMNDPLAVGQLQRSIVDATLSPLLSAALAEAGRDADALRACVIAGNTTMLHLLAGVDPTSIGVSPFTPVFRDYRRLSTADLALRPWASAASGCDVHLLPSSAAYIGADIVAGVLATGMAYGQRPSLLLDLGTNGEIVLHDGHRFWACSTAAGPAFEGAGLLCGVRAGVGAIAHLWFDESTLRPRTETIGSGRPMGLCGTAYLDFLARGRRAGLVGRNGRFAVSSGRDDLRRDPHHGLAMTVDHAPGNQPLVVSEADISALLQAKAAIAAGVECLLRKADLASHEIATVYLAGGFGFHMHTDSLLGCGLLPGFDPQQIQLVGNTSLAGAYAALLDASFLDELRLLADRLEILELNLEPDFESLYIDHLSLP